MAADLNRERGLVVAKSLITTLTCHNERAKTTDFCHAHEALNTARKGLASFWGLVRFLAPVF
jgi:hypothetical protein